MFGIVNGNEAEILNEYNETNFLSYTFPKIKNEQEEPKTRETMTFLEIVLLFIIASFSVIGLKVLAMKK